MVGHTRLMMILLIFVHLYHIVFNSYSMLALVKGSYYEFPSYYFI